MIFTGRGDLELNKTNCLETMIVSSHQQVSATSGIAIYLQR
jgi:hypothetical protein